MLDLLFEDLDRADAGDALRCLCAFRRRADGKRGDAAGNQDIGDRGRIRALLKALDRLAAGVSAAIGEVRQ